ncbi:molybdate ABC transporter permease subunit [Clostridium sp. P21]|uniref:Molybdenum transport system permease n=1 Tax=Clostridium muellerianum TaxID=2716538 RepID=A0A7Y0EJW8_9CLOT|nr:molybdate ABC transporter permease subunit [Clostridium muellerianum]NMM64841.1 molybdate ABC transporter permease subunit [Clostridium muellerianum]
MIISPIIISLKVSLISTIFTCIIGIALARLFTKYDFKGKNVLEVLIILPMVLPPSVTGYGLLVILGKYGFIGKLIFNVFNTSLIFTLTAACIASFIVSLPLMYQSCKAAFVNMDKVYENAARTLGASELKVFFKITLPMAFPGIISGLVLSFARALGEFGATLMVAGNIPGKTQTIPLAIYFAVESGDSRTANILVAIVLIFSFTTIYSLNIWTKRNCK